MDPRPVLLFLLAAVMLTLITRGREGASPRLSESAVAGGPGTTGVASAMRSSTAAPEPAGLPAGAKTKQLLLSDSDGNLTLLGVSDLVAYIDAQRDAAVAAASRHTKDTIDREKNYKSLDETLDARIERRGNDWAVFHVNAGARPYTDAQVAKCIQNDDSVVVRLDGKTATRNGGSRFLGPQLGKWDIIAHPFGDDYIPDFGQLKISRNPNRQP